MTAATRAASARADSTLPIGGGGLGVGTVVVLGLIGWAFGIDPGLLIGGAEIFSGGSPSHYEQPMRQAPRPTGLPADQTGQFVAAILGSADVQWTQLLGEQRASTISAAPDLVPQSHDGGACGMAQTAMGPFYCPSDREIYLDTSFFDELEPALPRLLRKGLRIRARLRHRARGRPSHTKSAWHSAQGAAGATRGQVKDCRRTGCRFRVELQADCFAGVWAYHSDRKWKLIEPGDVDAALQTASAIGDDMLQRGAAGPTVVVESFTHGSSDTAQALVHHRTEIWHYRCL